MFEPWLSIDSIWTKSSCARLLEKCSGVDILAPSGRPVSQRESGQGGPTDGRSCIAWQVPALTQGNWKSAIGEAAEHLLAAGLKAEAEQSERAEEQFAKIWPPANM
jgi:hypothetical protein